jgi:hypothetical protein
MGIVVRAGTAMPTIWQAFRRLSRGQVTIMGVAQRGKKYLSCSSLKS